MLRWSENLVPIDPTFDDKYFAEEDGLAESRYVFVGQNELKDRFANSDSFVIGELGFGTGLNFFATWDLWRSTRRPSAWLHYVSCEINPLSDEVIRRSCSRWPELNDLVESFLKSYRPFFPGIHRVRLDQERITLTLLIGDAVEMLPKLAPQTRLIDAWFLDGFAPRKNPAMWSESMFRHLERLSTPKATFATFTAAGWVKRNLQAAGFKVEKFKGFGRKREMLKGQLISETESAADRIESNPVRFQDITIVGAGLAGCLTAQSLALRGHRVKLIDRHAEVASEASGNPAAIMMPVLTAISTPACRLSLAGLRLLVDLLERQDFLLPHRGVLQIIRESKEMDRMQRAVDWLKLPTTFAEIISRERARELSGVTVSEPALYYPWATSASPKRICEAVLSSQLNRIEFKGNTELKSFTRAGSRWICNTNNGAWEADCIVFANAQGLTDFQDFQWIPLKPVRGQICTVKAPDANRLRMTLSAERTVTTANDGSLCVGSTYDRENLDLGIRAAENETMLNDLNQRFADLNLHTRDIVSSRAQWRSATVERIPVVGPLKDRQGNDLPNLFAACGLSSRGILFAPLCAEILAGMISHEPLPVEQDLIDAVSVDSYWKKTKNLSLQAND